MLYVTCILSDVKVYSEAQLGYLSISMETSYTHVEYTVAVEFVCIAVSSSINGNGSMAPEIDLYPHYTDWENSLTHNYYIVHTHVLDI